MSDCLLKIIRALVCGAKKVWTMIKWWGWRDFTQVTTISYFTQVTTISYDRQCHCSHWSSVCVPQNRIIIVHTSFACLKFQKVMITMRKQMIEDNKMVKNVNKVSECVCVLQNRMIIFHTWLALKFVFLRFVLCFVMIKMIKNVENVSGRPKQDDYCSHSTRRLKFQKVIGRTDLINCPLHIVPFYRDVYVYHHDDHGCLQNHD